MVFIWTELLKFCVQDIGIFHSLSLLMYSQVILIRTRNPPFLIFKELFILGATIRQLHHSIFSKIEKTLAVCTGLEPVTSCVAPNGRIELPQLPIDNFFNQKTYRIERQSTRYGSYDF